MAEWTAVEVIAWLKTLGIGPGLAVDIEEMVEGPYIPDTPDVVGVVTPVTGPGETLDGAGDVLGFQLLIRGEQDQPSSAMRLGHAADRLIRFSGFPMDVAGGQLRLARVMRSGGGPIALPTEDDGDRVSSVCTYLTEIIR